MFYEALDDLDQYDIGLKSDSNFFIDQIHEKNQKTLIERMSMRDSFLEKEKWKVVNPTMKLFESNKVKIEFSEKKK